MERRLVLLTLLAGLVIAGPAIAYGEGTGKPQTDVLFSGQQALPPLIQHAASYTVAALVLLMVCKGIAYCIALSSFRGGPVFPGMFIGAAAAIALSHLPGLPLIPGIAIGIAAMTTGLLQLPLTAVLLTTLLLGTDGVKVMPVVIVAGALPSNAASVGLVVAIVLLTTYAWSAGRVADLHGRQLLVFTSVAAGLGLLMITMKDGSSFTCIEAGSETASRARGIPAGLGR